MFLSVRRIFHFSFSWGAFFLNRDHEEIGTAQKMKFSIKGLFSKCDQIVDLVTFTEEILDGKLHFLCSEGAQ